MQASWSDLDGCVCSTKALKCLKLMCHLEQVLCILRKCSQLQHIASLELTHTHSLSLSKPNMPCLKDTTNKYNI